MPEEKNYINGIIIKEKSFDNGGSQLKISVKFDEFFEQLKAINEKGWVNLIVSRRKEPSDKGVTHYAFEDPWKPSTEYKPNATDQHGSKYGSEEANKDKDELPF
tara:strand:- start:2993 stop:3304 length:312 start_codon:yes stop_codon:yes gene_type:complete